MMQTCPRVSLPVRLQETLRKYTYVIVLDQKALRKRQKAVGCTCWVRQQQVRRPRVAAVYCWSCRRGVAEGRGWTAWLEGGAFLGLEV